MGGLCPFWVRSILVAGLLLIRCEFSTRFFFRLNANIGSREACLRSILASASPMSSCKGAITVTSQQDVDNQLWNCETVDGMIIIASNYSGSLVLSNVKNITSGIMMESLIKRPIYVDLQPVVPNPPQNLTSLEADSVRWMGSGEVRLVELPILKSVSMASLRDAWAINVVLNTNGTLNFPALEMVNNLHVFGNISR